jgi:hypothetical protein
VITLSVPLYVPALSGFVPVMLYVPAMSGAGALLVLVLKFELLFVFFDDSSLLFELELDEVEVVVVDLQPSTMPASSASASTLRCRDRFFMVRSNLID